MCERRRMKLMREFRPLVGNVRLGGLAALNSTVRTPPKKANYSKPPPRHQPSPLNKSPFDQAARRGDNRDSATPDQARCDGSG